jgi:glyoxylase-like metal-dependent hydrolase (beta-lactamase superfamily II)/8-oxo-dGTP pyrophosphatase MutT (NUDIX family)
MLRDTTLLAGPPVVPRASSTLILVRDGATDIEVFMVQRTQKASFMAGVYVFPGGAVDRADGEQDCAAFSTGLDDVAASALLGVEHGGLAYWIAAMRECFEEAGLLFANDASGAPVRIDSDADRELFSSLRKRLKSQAITLADLCCERQLHLAPERLHYFSHWTTPAALPKRFDTRFFLALVPPGQSGTSDQEETIAHAWMRPADALARAAAGEIELAFATVQTLEELSLYSDSKSLIAALLAPREIKQILPRIALANGERKVLLEDDHAYAEVGLLDPLGKGIASCDIIGGAVVQLTPRLRRITAPNPGLMTGPGTNTYLIGDGDDLIVIDPGPALDTHVETLMQVTQGRIRAILVTHTHPDHSPAATLLKAKTGAPLYGLAPPAGARQDQTFVPDFVVSHGARLPLGGCVLRVLHTPGHASNQVCYLLEEEGILFTGDHIMQGSTVVIDPPDGNMDAYLASLYTIQTLELSWLAPGHGFLMDQPQAAIGRLIAHRLRREGKILDQLRRIGPASIDQLLPAVYDDVPPDRHWLAQRSLLAHLQKLRGDDLARESQGTWDRVASTETAWLPSTMVVQR